jgi:hypothetical protein
VKEDQRVDREVVGRMARESAQALQESRAFVERTVQSEVHEQNSRREKDFAAIESEMRRTYQRSVQV